MANNNHGNDEERNVMVGQWADPNKIECTDCVYRDRTTVELGGREIPIGATRCFCLVFKEGETLKPTGITLRGEHCDYFEREG